MSEMGMLRQRSDSRPLHALLWNRARDAFAFQAPEKLRVQFRKYLRKGYVRNAQLDPQISSAVLQLAEANECFVVKVDRSKGGQLWLSDRRVLFEDEGVRELFRYDSVRSVHWMFRNLRDRLGTEPGTGSNLKKQYFDRLEVDLGDQVCVLDGLDQAYSPVYDFFLWMLKSRPRPTEAAQ